MSVNTKRVAGRRELHFQSLDDILAEAQMLATSNARTLGNWTLAQIFEHLARSLEASLDGVQGRVPLAMRILARPFKKRFLSKPTPSGFQLPSGVRRDLLPSDEASTEAALHRLRVAIERSKSQSHREPHLVFGRISEQEHNQIQLRHAEMHLSFAVPQE